MHLRSRVQCAWCACCADAHEAFASLASGDAARPLSNILVGTASWTDKSLIKCGRYYPADVKTAEERLRFYAGEFPLVEVDSSYYAIPSEQTARLWVERTPADFVFDVKAFRLFTQHQ